MNPVNILRPATRTIAICDEMFVRAGAPSQDISPQYWNLVGRSPWTAADALVGRLGLARASTVLYHNWIQLPANTNPPTAKPPRLPSLLLALLPFAAMCFSVSAWDRIYPMILGLPFNLFWLTSWIVLTPLCMWGAYRLETPRRNKDNPPT